MQTIAVLLTVFNRKEKTLKCLECLYACLPLKGYAVDVYLTDDGCTDGTPEAIKEQFAEVNIIHANGNLYWNRGMHTAWKKAAQTQEYDFFLWLNDDTYLYENALETLLSDSAEVGDQAIICGATCSAETGEITYGGRNKGILTPPEGKMLACRYFNGNVVLIPRYVFKLLGNLDYYYSHALGDFDYGMRAGEAGIGIFQSARFIGTCERHDSLPKWCNSRYPLTERMKAFRSPLGGNPKENFYFEKKHFGLPAAGFHYITIFLRLIFPQRWEKRN